MPVLHLVHYGEPRGMYMNEVVVGSCNAITFADLFQFCSYFHVIIFLARFVLFISVLLLGQCASNVPIFVAHLSFTSRRVF